MTTNEIANKLVELCRKGDFLAAQTQLFAGDAVSIEPHAAGGFEKETRGLDAMRKKGEQWNNLVKETHSLAISDPIVANGSFACTMHMDITMQDGQRVNMTELCVYKLKDGKIISEEFSM